jgi:HAE1 family hydrophobic/amphiphilic exporter-1
MALSKQIIRKPVTVLILFGLLLLLSLYVSFQLPIDLFPDINPPFLLVMTSYEGASPEEVESGVSKVLEGALTNVNNVQNLNSTSSEGTSLIMLEFGWNQDLSAAANDVRDKMEFVKDFLPDEAASPQIFILDPSMMPILYMSLSGDRPAEELNEIAENMVQPYLERVPGVSTTSLSGGREKAVRVDIPQNRLDAYDLSLTQISQMLASQNVDTSAGSIQQGDRKILLETAGEYASIQEIADTVISYKGGSQIPGMTSQLTTIRLRDIAKVYESYKDQSTAVFINGSPGIYITLQKQSGINSVKTADLVMEQLDVIRESLPAGVELNVIYDSTKMIRSSLQGVSSSAILGAILAMAVLFFFLRNLKSTLIIGISIPLSLLFTTMLMYFAGLTLNLMTLAGLTLGIGMIVDSSIVILENIYRYREKGAKLLPAAELGTQEMITAISASTLTTVSVFLPVIMFKSQLDIIGVIFQDMAFTIIITLMASLFIAFTLVPVLASKFLPLYTRKQRPLKEGVFKKIDDTMDRFFTGMDNGYKRFLHYILDHKGRVLAIILLLFVLSMMAIGFIGMELMPSAAEDAVQLEITMPAGTSLEETKRVLGELETQVLQDIHGIESLVTMSGTTGEFFSGDASHLGMLMVILPPFEERQESSQEIKAYLRDALSYYPGVDYNFSQGGGSMGNASPIDIEIQSEDLQLARQVAEEIKTLIEDSVPIVTEPEISMGEGLPQVEIVVDRDKAYSLGLNIYSIGAEVSANIDGKVATRYYSNGNEYDVVLSLEEQDRQGLEDLDRIFVMNSMGQKVALSSFATTRMSISPTSITRENRKRLIHVTAGLMPKVTPDEADRQVRRVISENIVQRDDVAIAYNGDFQETQRLMKKFKWILLIAVLLVYGVMASLFESLIDPFIIFLSMPLMLIGIVFLYLATGTPISMFSAVGVVMLAGITVNNGIVLVDYTNLLRERGMTIREACVEAGGNRLRPVLMTSLTTILGMLPMAFSKGEGSELVQPIGQTVVGGMTISTLLTLIFVPLVYSYFNSKHEIKQKERKRKTRAMVLANQEGME